MICFFRQFFYPLLCAVCIILFSNQILAQENNYRRLPPLIELFEAADPATYALAQKIAHDEDISLDEVKALPNGALNKRYELDRTLLFHALAAYHLQAIDVLLQAGADPHMVDYPSLGSIRDLTYYTAAFYGPIDLDEDFKTNVLRLYLKHGGDPNHRLRSDVSLFEYIIAAENYSGAQLMLQAGADTLAYDGDGTSNPAIRLASHRNRTSRRLLHQIVCRGDFDHADNRTVQDIFRAFKPSGWEGSEREVLFTKLSMRILKHHQAIEETEEMKARFGGSIPWDEIMTTSDEELCNG